MGRWFVQTTQPDHSSHTTEMCTLDKQRINTILESSNKEGGASHLEYIPSHMADNSPSLMYIHATLRYPCLVGWCVVH